MTAFEWAMLVMLSVLWGGSFFFNGVAVKELPTFTIVVSRVALATLVLLSILRLRGGGISMRPDLWRSFFIMALLNNVVPFSLFVWAQSHIASGVAAILNATTPLFTVVVAHFLTADEKLTTGRVLGVVVGLLGVGVMIGSDALQLLGTNILAQTACLAGALSYAFAGVFGRRFKAMGVSPIETATGQVSASTVLLLPILLIVDKPWSLPMPSAPAVVALIGIALLSTALAYTLYFRILQTAGATNLLLVTFLIPISATILGGTVLGETLQLKHLLGMALIGCGLAAIDGRPLGMIFRSQHQSSGAIIKL